MKFIFMLSWAIPIFGTVASVLAATGSPAEPITQVDKVEALIWTVGILVTALGFLILLLIKVLWEVHKQNKLEHARLEKLFRDDSHTQWNHLDGLEADLNNLLGQHEVAFSLKGCAYEPERLKEAMRSILTELASESTNLFKSQRRSTDDDSTPSKG